MNARPDNVQPFPSARSLPDPDLPQEPFPLLDYLQLLWFRRRLIVVITLLAAVLAWIYVGQLQSVYTATSSLQIGVKDTQPADLNAFLYQRYFGTSAVEEIEILKSRGLAEKVILRLDLLTSPEFNPSLREPETGLFSYLRYLNPVNWIPATWKAEVSAAISGELVPAPVDSDTADRRAMARAVDIFLGKLKATPIEYSDIILLSFASPDPRMAARLANTLPDLYIVDKLEAKFEASQRVTTWLSEQLAELEQKVRDSEQAVEMYREQHGFTEGAKNVILDEQLSSLNSQLIIARAERAEAEARLAQIQRLLVGSGQGVETAAEVLSSPLIQQLRNQEAEVMRRSSELAVEFGPKHPRMLQVNAELADVRQRIGEETRKIVLGLENELEVARSRESSLGQSLADAEQATGMQNREAVQLRALEREAAANRTLFENFLERFKETSTTQGTETPEARIISMAEVPARPSWPNRQRTFGIIVLLGFLGACALVFAIHVLNPGLLSPEQIEQELGVHAIGMIPRVTGRQQPHAVVLDQSTSNYVEAINSLKISLQLADPDTPMKVILVTSSVPEEGKSTLVVMLGTVLAKSGHKVIVLDGDLRRSGIGKKLDLPKGSPGLTDMIIDESNDVAKFVVHHEPTGVDFMRTGQAHYVSASDLFASKRMRNIIQLMRDRYDYVLIDTPPVMAVADARVIGQLADRTLFVVRWDKTPRKVARAALELLHKSGIKLAGVVLQQVDLKRYGRLGYGDSGYYYHYGRYGQYYK